MAFQVSEFHFRDQGPDQNEFFEVRANTAEFAALANQEIIVEYHLNVLPVEAVEAVEEVIDPETGEVLVEGVEAVEAVEGGVLLIETFTFTAEDGIQQDDGFTYFSTPLEGLGGDNGTGPSPNNTIGLAVIADGELQDFVSARGGPANADNPDTLVATQGIAGTAGEDGLGAESVFTGIFENGQTSNTSSSSLQPDGTFIITEANQQTPGAINVCYLEGSMITTVNGDKAVEALEAGDLLLTAEGNEVPVKWMGKQTVVAAFATPERTAPVLIKANALGENTPSADLYVTADHGMIVDGIVAHASALVNGTSIVRVPLTEMEETFTFYHIETEKHEVILANGAPAETFIDNVSREVFDNYAEFEALFGTNVAEMEELDMPRALSQRQLPGSIKAKLGIKAAVAS